MLRLYKLHRRASGELRPAAILRIGVEKSVYSETGTPVRFYCRNKRLFLKFKLTHNNNNNILNNSFRVGALYERCPLHKMFRRFKVKFLRICL